MTVSQILEALEAVGNPVIQVLTLDPQTQTPARTLAEVEAAIAGLNDVYLTTSNGAFIRLEAGEVTDHSAELDSVLYPL